MSDEARSEKQNDEAGSGSVPTCYRHPERESYIRCQRCDRFICPDCQRQASVGFQCVECVREAARSTAPPRTRFGGVLRPGDGGIVTKTLIGLNVAVFLLVQVLGNTFVEQVDLIGVSLFSQSTGEVTTGVADGGYWRLLTSAFVHIQLWHIAINMLALWVLGRPLEHVLGRLRFVGLYLVTALTGSAAAYALTAPNLAIVGASGAIFGLFGATVIFYRRLRLDMTWIIGLLVVNLALNIFASSILSWQGHLGGLVGGLLLGGFLAYAPRENRDRVQLAGFVVVLVLTAVVVVWRTLSLLSGGAS